MRSGHILTVERKFSENELRELLRNGSFFSVWECSGPGRYIASEYREISRMPGYVVETTWHKYKKDDPWRITNEIYFVKILKD